MLMVKLDPLQLLVALDPPVDGLWPFSKIIPLSLTHMSHLSPSLNKIF